MEWNWLDKKNILCIRPDNMGDVLMSSPAIRALKESFNCRITLLTSSMASAIATMIPEIDEVIPADMSWVKAENTLASDEFLLLVKKLENQHFDAAIIFTVFSQNPMPSILLAWLAKIPLRLAYCRENPYGLLTHWIPEKEPYDYILHQVIRDLKLVENVGAFTYKKNISIDIPQEMHSSVTTKINLPASYIVFSPCASEIKRQYPVNKLKDLIKDIISQTELHILITGTEKDKQYIDDLIEETEGRVTSVAGLFSIGELAAFIEMAPLVISVNSGPVHIAAAVNTPVIVLYALTNPQHIPWMVENEIFYFPVAEELKSKNEVLQYVDKNIIQDAAFPENQLIIDSVRRILKTAYPSSVEQDQYPESLSSQ